MPEQTEYRSVLASQLKVGMFIRLDLKWTQHPFMTSSFKIKNTEQINIIRGLGLSRIQYDPARSDTQPEMVPDSSGVSELPAEPSELSATRLAAIEAKKTRAEQMAKRRQAVADCEKKFFKAAATMKDIHQTLISEPKKSLAAAHQLLNPMVDWITTDRDIALQIMGNKGGGQEVYFHSLNVAVLSMILGKEMKCTKQQIAYLGLGSVFHDAGKIKIPDKILKKTHPLTSLERNFYEQHPIYSEAVARNLNLPAEIQKIARHHHEAMDGSGYPDRIEGTRLSVLIKIIAITNTFDGYCNMPNPADSMTPYEALSKMYARERGRFDAVALPVFIRTMGVYPPGTIVRMSNNMIGLVISVNSTKPLKPNVLVYDPDVPKDEAIILDLEQETEITIVKTLRPDQLLRDAHIYLSPRKRVTYYFDEAPNQGAPPMP